MDQRPGQPQGPGALVFFGYKSTEKPFPPIPEKQPHEGPLRQQDQKGQPFAKVKVPIPFGHDPPSLWFLGTSPFKAVGIENPYATYGPRLSTRVTPNLARQRITGINAPLVGWANPSIGIGPVSRICYPQVTSPFARFVWHWISPGQCLFPGAKRSIHSVLEPPTTHPGGVSCGFFPRPDGYARPCFFVNLV